MSTVTSVRAGIPGRIILILLMVVTIVPFVSVLLTALHASGTYPSGVDLPKVLHWENFVEAFRVANMGALLLSSAIIVIAVVPISMLISTMNDVPGRQVTEVLGEVTGLTVRARNAGVQLGANFKALLGGELSGLSVSTLGMDRREGVKV